MTRAESFIGDILIIIWVLVLLGKPTIALWFWDASFTDDGFHIYVLVCVSGIVRTIHCKHARLFLQKVRGK